ncbi:hypothetical protein HCN44_007181 [Aphidius gifuensis]|uniref:Uncharacterized protein n=1 Tax=Aphidius gifuensis TaxID=684658 RepID=A0A834XLE4_APHGI|nr:hypothetical protein HCN44_007181 [Aphidius gifuensis]
MENLVNIKTLQEEIRIARPTGDVDFVFKKYCDKKPQFLRCITHFMDKLSPCLEQSEKDNHQTVNTVMDSFNIKEILREMRIIRQAEVTLKDLTSQMEMESIKNPDHNPEDDDNDWESDNDWHLMVAGERALYDGEEIIKCNKKNE